MEDFLSVLEKKRKKAIIKVAIRRYGIFAFLPLLIFMSYFVGKLFKNFMFGDAEVISTCQYIAGGLAMIMVFLIGVFALWSIISFFIKSFIRLIRDIFSFIIDIPKMIIYRIKDEKRRFLDEVDKEMHYSRY